MTKSSLPKIILDADPLLSRWGLPHWAWARIRELRVGESLLLVDFDGPGIGKCPGTAGVSLTRERGGTFRLEAGWLAHLGKNAQRRGHLWAWVDFKMLPKRQLELVQPDGAPGQDTRRRALQLVQVVMRRAVLLARWAKRDGDDDAFIALAPQYFMTRHDSEEGAMVWLEKLRGPALVRDPAPTPITG